MQGDLFKALPPPEPTLTESLGLPADGGSGFDITRCGVCVHKSGAVDEDGNCSPMGRRRWNDATCDWRFGREQLRLSLQKMPKEWR